MPVFLNSILLEGVVDQTPVLYEQEEGKVTSFSLLAGENIFAIRAHGAMAQKCSQELLTGMVCRVVGKAHQVVETVDGQIFNYAWFIAENIELKKIKA